jgi:hypothetical protein
MTLLSLVAYGDEDFYITGDPEVEAAKWRRKWARMTPAERAAWRQREIDGWNFLYPKPGIFKRIAGFVLSPFVRREKDVVPLAMLLPHYEEEDLEAGNGE